MLRPEKRNPAAPKLLGSKGAGGAEHFDMQADNDHEDMSPAGFFQSFQSRSETVRDYARPQCGLIRALPLSGAGRMP